jgi:hypothetical protein
MATRETKAQDEAHEENRPVRTFRARGCRVSVFENRTKDEAGRESVWFKASLRRVYREGEEFKTTTSLSVTDVPVALHLLSKAFEFMLEAEAARRAPEPRRETS